MSNWKKDAFRLPTESIMPCQLCESKAFSWYDIDTDTSLVSCKHCMIRIQVEEHSLPTHETEILAAKKWNDLQRLIARGKLLDEAPTKSGGRL